MDNKQDRQFYWEVKDFMSKSNVPVTPKAQKPNMLSSVKSVLEQNNIYRPSSFNANINSPNIIRQAISSMESIKANGTPNCKAFTKNIASNPFKVIKEGVFDEVNADIEKYSKISGMSPNATNDELEYQIGQQDVQPGVPLTPEQQATRDLQGAFQRKQAVQQQMEKEARVQSGQTKINPNTGGEYSVKPQDTAPAPAASPAPETSDTQPDEASDEDQPTREDEQDQKLQSTVDKEKAAAPAPKAVDDQLEARVKARIAKRERDVRSERQSGEENLAYLQSKGAAADPRGLVRAQRRAAGESTQRLSDEEIRGQEERQLARERRTPEEKAAKAAENKAVVDKLNAAADAVRAREAQQKGGKAPMPYSERAGATPDERNANAPKAPMPYSERGDGAPAGQGTSKPVSPGAVRQPSSTPAPATPGKTTAPGKAPAPAGQDSSLSLKISDGTPSTPAQTGGQVNDKVRQTLGLGASSAPEQASSPGVQGARATLGLGSGSAPAQTATPGVQGARATLGLGGGAPANPAKAPAPAPESTAKPAPTPAPAPASSALPSVRETLGLGPAPAANNTPEETEAQKKARQALMSR